MEMEDSSPDYHHSRQRLSTRALPAVSCAGMDVSFTSAVVILLLVMDPLGNIPLFVAMLRNTAPARRMMVIARECAIAFAVLLVFAFFGQQLLALLGLSDSSLNIAGGVILFLIALRMIFKHPEGIFGDADTVAGEPFIVPLAIPSIAGPTALATVVIMVSRAPERMFDWIMALSVAMAITLALLAFAERLSTLVGERGLVALERLMGLLLTAIAVEMLLRGIETFVRQI
jgi:MarC family membrane protein